MITFRSRRPPRHAGLAALQHDDGRDMGAVAEEIAEALADEAAAEAQEAPAPTFTPNPLTATGPLKAARPYAPVIASRCRPLIFEAMGGVTVLPCAWCGAQYADADATWHDKMLSRMRRTAREAGWGTDQYGHWCCPACLPPRWLPELAGGLEAEWDLWVRNMIAAGRYEDVDGATAEIAAREARIRIAEDVAEQLEGREAKDRRATDTEAFRALGREVTR